MFPQSSQATATRLLAFLPSLAPPNLQCDASKPHIYPSEHSNGRKSFSTTTCDEGSHIPTDHGCRILVLIIPTIESIRAKGTSSASNSPVAFAST
jgi:hypothetical protein